MMIIGNPQNHGFETVVQSGSFGERSSGGDKKLQHLWSGSFVSQFHKFFSRLSRPDPARSISAIVGFFIVFVVLFIFSNANMFISPESDSSKLLVSPNPAIQGISNGFYVTRVVDGDTIDVRDSSGKEFTVRLIGIDTPEVHDPRTKVECFGKEASAEMSNLVDSQYVRLEDDETQDNLDRYGRLLRYVYLSDETFVNKEMISKGFAYEYTYKVSYEFQSEFKQAQENAQKEMIGLWSEKTCNGRR